MIGVAVGIIAYDVLPAHQKLLSAVLSGAAGSVLGLWFFADLLGIDPVVSFGTLSLWNILFGIIGSIFLITFIELTMEPVQKSMKKYDKELIFSEIIKVAPVYTHQFEKVNIKRKNKLQK